MSSKILYSLTLCIGLMCSCSPLRESTLSKYNKFTYENEQPRFNFENDSLRIRGSWNWSSDSRAMPSSKMIPKTARGLYKKLSSSKGNVLISTWSPNRKKYSVPGFVPVTKADVRFAGKFSVPFYILVFETETLNTSLIDNLNYLGQNIDAQFKVYSSKPIKVSPQFWMMDIVATGNGRTFSFVSLADTTFMRTEEIRLKQLELFATDIKMRFQMLD